MAKTRTGRLGRLIAILLIVIMICSMLPVIAFAAGPITGWAELQSALNAGGTVTLTQSITAGSGDTALTVPVGVTVTLDLNGFTLDRAADSRSDANRSITINGNLTLKDSSAGRTGTVKGGCSLDGSDVYVAAGATFTMYGGSIIGHYYPFTYTTVSQFGTNSGVHVAAGATFTMYDGKISNHVGATGNTGGVRLYGGTFVMYGGEISRNSSMENGGGVCMENGATFTMHGGKITNTYGGLDTDSDAWGAGVYMSGGSTFTMKGGEISNHEYMERSYSCYVYVDGKSSFIMEGGKISADPSSDSYGSLHDGVRVTRDSSFTMSGGEISNHAEYGVDNYGTFTMTGGKITGNLSGGMYNEGTFIMSGGEIFHNSGGFLNYYVPRGGVWNLGTFTMTGGKISENTLWNNYFSGAAGGVSVIAGTFTMTGGEISDNVSRSEAGGVGLSENGVIQVSGTPTVTGNKRSDGKENNVNLKDGQYIDVIGELKDGAAVGVTTQTEPTVVAPVEFSRDYTTSGNSNDPAFFFTSDAGYDVRLNGNNEAELYIKGVEIGKIFKLENDNTTSPSETFYLIQTNKTSTDSRITGDAIPDLIAVTDDGYTGTGRLVGKTTFAQGAATVAGTRQNIFIMLPEYTAVGVYKYTLSEVDNKTAGVTYWNNDIELVITVMVNKDRLHYVGAVHCEEKVPAGETPNAKTDNFTNIYSAASDLSFSKTVTGNLGDRDKYFDFTVTFTGKSGDVYSSAPAVTVAGGTHGDNPRTVDITSGSATVNFKLKHGETLHFANIPYGMTYSYSETNADGYIATYSQKQVGTGETDPETGNEVMTEVDDMGGEVKFDTKEHAVTNKKNGTIDTGILLDNLPYITALALILLAVAAFFVFKKRRYAADCE